MMMKCAGESNRWDNQGGDATEGPVGKPSKGTYLTFAKQDCR